MLLLVVVSLFGCDTKEPQPIVHETMDDFQNLKQVVFQVVYDYTNSNDRASEYVQSLTIDDMCYLNDTYDIIEDYQWYLVKIEMDYYESEEYKFFEMGGTEQEFEQFKERVWSSNPEYTDTCFCEK